MGLLDDAEQEGKDIMNDPGTRAKIEQIAKDKGISLEQAKDHFLQHGDQQQ